MLRRMAVGIAIGGAVLLVLDAAAVRLGLAPGAIPKLAGPSLWITSRAAGVAAFVALTLDVVFGLLVSTRAADSVIQRAKSVELHRWLSTIALGMTAVHALALLGDRFVSFDLLDLLVPLSSSYRSFAVALGIVAAYGALLIHASFGWRRRIGSRVWRTIHYGSFAVFLIALVHGLLAGSDSSAAAMHVLYASAATAVAGLVILRVARPRRSRRRTGA